MSKWKYILTVMVAAIVVSVVPALAQEEAAETAVAEETAAAEEMTTIERRVYIYEIRDRRDPFVSLIAPPKTEEELTGDPLRDNDISQMRVIAIVSDAEKGYALFGLPDGKFYTVTEGREVGIHGGNIEEILEDRVLIREQKTDFRGDLRPVDTYLRLRKEEGQ